MVNVLDSDEKAIYFATNEKLRKELYEAKMLVRVTEWAFYKSYCILTGRKHYDGNSFIDFEKFCKKVNYKLL